MEPTPLAPVPALGNPDFAREAILALDYLHPAAEGTLVQMIEDIMVHSPRAITTAFRKAGEQITTAEKKVLGLRANAFLSRLAVDQLTANGLAKPLEAHEVTLRRAVFAQGRFKTIVQTREAGYDEFKYSSFGDGICPACGALDGKIVKGSDVLIFPPAGCLCETGRYGLSPHIDFLAGLEDEY